MRLSPKRDGFAKLVDELGILFVIGTSRTALRLAIIAVAAMALSGCGRKGPLDLPPGAAQQLAAERAAAAAPVEPPSSVSSQAGALFSAPGDDGAPVAPRVGKRPFILDPLLD